MMAGVGRNIIKYILFIFNLIFAISGLGLIIAGSIVVANVTEYDHFIENRAITMPVILIVLGIVVFAVASLGCYGAIKESPKLLIAFATFLAIIFIIELAIGIAAAVYQSELQDALKRSLEHTIARSNPEDTVAWNKIQKSLKCCGVTNQGDWQEFNRNRSISRPSLPASCCRPEYIDATTTDCMFAPPLYKDKYYVEGCLPILKEQIEKNTTALVGVGIGISLIQLLGIVLALWLASRIRKDHAK